MPFSHLLLALVVVTVWGINFLFVTFALEEISPLMLCASRFILASVPAIFFIKPPTVSFKVVASYGLIMFALQFTLLFVGMHVGMTPGMASLIMQTQVFFSMFFAAFLLGEKSNSWQILGALISFVGIGLVAAHFDSNISLLGFICILAAAASWGMGNLITKKTNKVSMLALVVWGSFIASVPIIFITIIVEGPQAIIDSFSQLSWLGTSSIFYIVYLSTWIGYGVWNWLLSRYPVGTIVPFTLLVPVVGVISSILILNEPFQPWKMLACALVISGLFINIFGTRIRLSKLEHKQVS